MKIEKVDPAEFGLEAAQGAEVEQVFLPVIAEREALAESYEAIVNSEMSKELVERARELRLKLVKVRTSTEKIHKTAKAFYLAGGRFVDAWKNRNITAVTLMEERLFEIEDHYEQVEREELEALKQERFGRLSHVCSNPELYQYWLMTDEAFEDLLLGQTLILEAKKERERKALEEARIEAERIEAEAAELKATYLRMEAEKLEAEKALEEERKRAEADRLETEKALQAITERIKAEKLEAEKVLEEERRKADEYAAEQQREKLEAEKVLEEERNRVKALVDANLERERKAVEDQKRLDEEYERAKAAPARERIAVWLESLHLPEDPNGEPTLVEIADKLAGFKKWANNKLKTL